MVMATPGQQPDEGELLSLLPGCIGYLAGVETISAHAIEAANSLRVISRNGTGIDNIDMEAARKKGITVCRAEGANARGVAELTIALLLSLMRSIPFSDSALKRGGWERRKGKEVGGSVLGVVGTGRIGSLVSHMAAGLGMKVIGFDPFPNPVLEDLGLLSYVSLTDLFSRADVITLHCPMPQDGKPLISDDSLDCMRQGSYLVNTARSGLIDSSAVHRALDSGKLRGLALDVFDVEPPADRTLIEHDRVIASPHIGAFTVESIAGAVDVAVDNILKTLAEEARK